MSISAVVPVWNGREFLRRLLDTLDAQTVRPEEVLAIDNGSTDGAPDLARERGARVIAMGRNAGFAAAVNRGIRESRGKWIAVLNSDVRLAPDYFAVLSSSDAWFATGRILRPSGDVLDGAFDLTCRGACTWRAGNGRADGPPFSSPRRIFSPPWTAALFRAELFRRAGYLEESFESYLEDVDFGLRCAGLGLDGVYDPRAVAWHHGSASLGPWHPDTVRRIARNQIFLVARYYPRSVRLRCAWPVVVAQLLWGGVALRHGAGFAWLRGKWEGLAGWGGHSACPKFPDFLDHLRRNESLIYRLQAATGFDLYWRLYFLLAGVRQSDTCPTSAS